MCTLFLVLGYYTVIGMAKTLTERMIVYLYPDKVEALLLKLKRQRLPKREKNLSAWIRKKIDREVASQNFKDV